MRRVALLVVTIACSGGGGVPIPSDRPLLLWTSTSASDANRALLPKGFTAPSETACAADTTRAYLGEIFVHGIDNPQVNWHWAPIVPGPTAATPTLGQPEFSLAGTIAPAGDSGDDGLFHPPLRPDPDADGAP